MPIIGFNLTKVNGQKTGSVGGKVNITQDVKITKIEEDKQTISAPGDMVRFHFEFLTNYAPEVGSITLNGNMLYLGETKEVKEILKAWEKDKKIENEELLLSLMNTVMTKGTVKALSLAEELNLPPNIQLPKVRAKPKEN